MKTFAKTDLDFIRVYLITDRSLLPENRFLEGIESALAGGVRAIQLREKDLTPRELASLARQALAITRRFDAKLLINDRADVAAVVGAEGVHLTENSMPVGEVKKSFPQLIAGVSTHSLESAKQAAREGADFITFSPIFDTPSKREYGAPQGLDRLREVADQVEIPVLALGGIKIDNAASVLNQGAFGVALISGIWNSSNIKATSFQYCQFFSGETS